MLLMLWITGLCVIYWNILYRLVEMNYFSVRRAPYKIIRPRKYCHHFYILLPPISNLISTALDPRVDSTVNLKPR